MDLNIGNLSIRTAPGLRDPGRPCKNCSDINFEAFFSRAGSHDTIPSITVSDAATAEDNCRFCNLLMQGARQFTHQRRVIPYRLDRHLVFYFTRETRQAIVDDTGVLVPGGSTMKVRLDPPPSPLDINTIIEFVLCPIYTSDDVDTAQRSANLVIEDKIDLGLCQRWLRECEGQHPPACASPHTSNSVYAEDILVIDAVEQCIVPAANEFRYIALSYVWGVLRVCPLSWATGRCLVDLVHFATTHLQYLAQFSMQSTWFSASVKDICGLIGFVSPRTHHIKALKSRLWTVFTEALF